MSMECLYSPVVCRPAIRLVRRWNFRASNKFRPSSGVKTSRFDIIKGNGLLSRSFDLQHSLPVVLRRGIAFSISFAVLITRSLLNQTMEHF